MPNLRLPFTLLAASLSFAAAACKSGQDGQNASPPQTPVAASGSGDFRVDPSTVVLTWSGGQLTYGELYKKHEGEFKKLKRKYDSDVYAAEQQSLEGWIVQQLVE